jgi:ribonuclease E
MTTRMLIDAAHTEETRVVVVKGNRLDEFDFESSTKKQLKGNIYLAKVTRVEPSLQAAFVDYGGNRHGFLAFNEIHPDYYQIPVADREALLEEEAKQAAEEAALDEAEAESDAITEIAAGEVNGDDDDTDGEGIVQERDDALDEVPRPRNRVRRSYKIQEVIKKRQILLVQVVKEERGNKGAALTSYLSLAGRYCVLMPNTARGGGISRKIANQVARRKLKKIVGELDVPEGMGVIVRTAGQSRTKAEIRRDFDYLLRLWNSVRELTLESTAPTLVYGEADLIKRAVRDLYTKDVDEILVDGDTGYRAAKDFMRMLLPSHAKKVQPYRDRIPLFHRYQVEQQLDTMHSNVVNLKSGGYLVFSPTEALVAVDVNSGRSTRERNIEETALKTNQEAAEEVARQLRLRDLAGLVVIDFIDMEEPRNNRAVERRLKDCLKGDRARIQVGRISMFGLLEMSRQRLRPSLFEASTIPCEHCEGSGFVRSTESTVLHVLRAIEEEGIRNRADELTIHVPGDIALYLLNQKRDALAAIESRYNFRVLIFADPELVAPNFRADITMARSAEAAAEVEAEVAAAANELLAREEAEKKAQQEAEKERKPRRRRRSRKKAEAEAETETDHTDAEGDEAGATVSEEADDKDNGEEKPKRRRRGRRGGRRRRASTDTEANGAQEAADQAEDSTAPEESQPVEATTDGEAPASEAAEIDNGHEEGVVDTTAAPIESETASEDLSATRATEAGPEITESPTDVTETPTQTETEPVPLAAYQGTQADSEPDPEQPVQAAPAALAPAVIEVTTSAEEAAVEAAAVAEPVEEEEAAAPEVKKPKRGGWWQRRKAN